MDHDLMRGALRALPACIALTHLIAAMPAQAAAPLEPTSKWYVDYDDAQCIATRNYGTDEKPLLLVLKPSPFGGIMRVLVIGHGYYRTAEQMIARVQFDDRPNIKTNTLRYSDEQRRLKIHSINLPMERFRAEQRAKSISIATPGADHSFAMADVPPLLVELEKCRIDLLDLWNFNRPERIRQPAEPKEPLQKIYSSSDYPWHAVRERNEGDVAIALLVDETGKVRDCSVDESAGAATLDTMSCYVIQERAKFTPAIGVDGKPVKSVFTRRIAWRIQR